MTRKRKILISAACCGIALITAGAIYISHDHTLLLIPILFFYIALMILLDRLPKKHPPLHKVALLSIGIGGLIPGHINDCHAQYIEHHRPIINRLHSTMA